MNTALRVIIVDDEANARLLLKSMLNEYISDIEIIEEAANVPEAVKKIHAIKPNLVFLDIEMPGYTGLEILDFFDKDKIDFEIIFVTAYSEFAVNAFDMDATDYLLKPIKKDRLDKAVERARKKLNITSQTINNIDKITINDKVALHSSEGLLLIDPSDIIYMKADGSYTNFILVDQKRITVAKTLNEFMRLEERGNFLRIHRSYIININHIKKVLKVDKGTLLMDDGMEISISNDKRDYLTRIIDKFRL
jgi:two-component system LytT family response regulator